MVKKDYTRCWKAADRRELHLIRLWEETALKQRLLGALLIIFIFTLLYILMVLNLLKHIQHLLLSGYFGGGGGNTGKSGGFRCCLKGRETPG